MKRIILDECLPKRLAKHLHPHDVVTVPQVGLAGFTDGELMGAIQDTYDVFITIDGNIEYQQNFIEMPIAVIVLRAASNRLADLLHLAPQIVDKADMCVPGQVMRLPE